jgi:hypothetical protein
VRANLLNFIHYLDQNGEYEDDSSDEDARASFWSRDDAFREGKITSQRTNSSSSERSDFLGVDEPVSPEHFNGARSASSAGVPPADVAASRAGTLYHDAPLKPK